MGFLSSPGTSPFARPAMVVLTPAGMAAAGIAFAAPASAHIEVSGKPAQAGATNAVITFDCEAESQTAGITGVKVQLPAGIGPTDVALVSGPSKWRLTRDATTYTVSGPALPAGEHATYAVRIAQLPAVRSLAFKSIQSYSDGRQDSWIELPAAGGGEPDMPAPVPALAPAAAAPTTTAPATTAPTTTAPATSAPANTPSTSPAAAQDTSDDGGNLAILWVVLAVVIGTVDLMVFPARRAGSGWPAGKVP